MKGQLTIQYLASFIFFIGLIVYIYFAYSANLPAFVEEVRKEDVRSKAFQLSEILLNDPGKWVEPAEVPVDVILVIDKSDSMFGENNDFWVNCRLNCSTFGSGICIEDGCVNSTESSSVVPLDPDGWKFPPPDGEPDGCPLCADCDNDGEFADPGESPCAINDAKDASSTFVYLLNSLTDQSGLVSFNGTAYLNQTLTNNQDNVNNSIYGLKSGRFTAIGDGIGNATDELTTNGRDDVRWVQVLLTDGNNNRGRDPEEAAVEANASNITIYTIGLGASFNSDVLWNISNITGGKNYTAPSSTDLVEIYKEIAYEIKLQPSRIGLSDETSNKTNLISMYKIRYLEDLCSSFENVQKKLALKEPFSIHAFNISQDSGERNLIMDCISPDFPKTTINTTIKRLTVLNNTETGRLELAEIIVQM